MTSLLDRTGKRGKGGATMKARKAAAKAKRSKSKWRFFLCCGK